MRAWKGPPLCFVPLRRCNHQSLQSLPNERPSLTSLSPPLGMTHNNPIRPAIFDHVRASLPSERSIALSPGILSSHGNV